MLKLNETTLYKGTEWRVKEWGLPHLGSFFLILSKIFYSDKCLRTVLLNKKNWSGYTTETIKNY